MTDAWQKKEKKIMLGSRQKVQSDNNTSNVNADDNAIAIEDNDDNDDYYHSASAAAAAAVAYFQA